jgi:hypothetical protein
MKGGPRFALTLVEAAKGADPAVPAIQRLKCVLKRLGRSYGFRAIGVLEEIAPKNTRADGAAPNGSSHQEPTP